MEKQTTENKENIFIRKRGVCMQFDVVSTICTAEYEFKNLALEEISRNTLPGPLLLQAIISHNLFTIYHIPG